MQSSTCVRESTATFPHILSPWRQRARVQSAPIYRGGKAAAAYLVEYLPLSTRGRCTNRVVTPRAAGNTHGKRKRVCCTVLSKSLGHSSTWPRFAWLQQWRGVAWRGFDRSPLFQRHAALSTVENVDKIHRAYGVIVFGFLRFYAINSIELWTISVIFDFCFQF